MIETSTVTEPLPYLPPLADIGGRGSPAHAASDARWAPPHKQTTGWGQSALRCGYPGDRLWITVHSLCFVVWITPLDPHDCNGPATHNLWMRITRRIGGRHADRPHARPADHRSCPARARRPGGRAAVRDDRFGRGRAPGHHPAGRPDPGLHATDDHGGAVRVPRL